MLPVLETLELTFLGGDACRKAYTSNINGNRLFQTKVFYPVNSSPVLVMLKNPLIFLSPCRGWGITGIGSRFGRRKAQIVGTSAGNVESLWIGLNKTSADYRGHVGAPSGWKVTGKCLMAHIMLQ